MCWNALADSEDGSLHSKSFAHTDKGMCLLPVASCGPSQAPLREMGRYFMGMTFMNYKAVRKLSLRQTRRFGLEKSSC